jgi:nicotinate-nucleotide adenylyltransferase
VKNSNEGEIYSLGILGGTFDPIHNGHLACAQDVHEHFHLDKIKFIPCAQTPHREQPQRSTEQRCTMVKLAIQEYSFMELDERECQREGMSYTVDTLNSLREDYGADCSLIFIMGSDTFQGISEWKESEKLLNLCHLLVLKRPGQEESFNKAVSNLIEKHQSNNKEELLNKAFGHIYFLEGSMLDISATRIRGYFDFNMPNASENIKALSNEIPDPVKQYIHQHGLYQDRAY